MTGEIFGHNRLISYKLVHPHILVRASSEWFLLARGHLQSWFNQYELLVATSVGTHRSLVHLCGWAICVCKSNRLHVNIIWFLFVGMGYNIFYKFL